jgi:hypothetical protein
MLILGRVHKQPFGDVFGVCGGAGSSGLTAGLALSSWRRTSSNGTVSSSCSARSGFGVSVMLGLTSQFSAREWESLIELVQEEVGELGDVSPGPKLLRVQAESVVVQLLLRVQALQRKQVRSKV